MSCAPDVPITLLAPPPSRIACPPVALMRTIGFPGAPERTLNGPLYTPLASTSVSPGFAVFNAACSRPGRTLIFGPPAGLIGAVQVVVRTSLVTEPPSGSLRESLTSYFVPPSRSKIDPASIRRPEAGREAFRMPWLSTPNRSSPRRHRPESALRYSMRTVALRLSSPPINQQKPRHLIVGNSSVSFPATDPLPAIAAGATARITIITAVNRICI